MTMAALGEIDLALDALLDAAQAAARAGLAADAEALSIAALDLAAGSDFSERLIGVWRSFPMRRDHARGEEIRSGRERLGRVPPPAAVVPARAARSEDRRRQAPGARPPRGRRPRAAAAAGARHAGDRRVCGDHAQQAVPRGRRCVRADRDLLGGRLLLGTAPQRQAVGPDRAQAVPGPSRRARATARAHLPPAARDRRAPVSGSDPSRRPGRAPPAPVGAPAHRRGLPRVPPGACRQCRSPARSSWRCRRIR